MRRYLPILSVWSLAYLVLLAIGARVGLHPMLVLLIFLLLILPPFFFCMRAARNVMNQTRLAFPEQWTTLNQGMKLELRGFLFDERTFGDETIGAWKRELRWWMGAGMIGILVFPLTLLLVQSLSR